jgi:ATP-binding cassette subfamily B protein
VSLSLDVTWPLDRLGEAMEATARQAGIRPRHVAHVPSPSAHPSLARHPGVRETEPRVAKIPRQLTRWADDAAAWLGVEVEPIETFYTDARALVSQAAPALLCVRDPAGLRYVAVVKSGKRHVTLLSPGGELVRSSVDEVERLLVEPFETAVAPTIDALLARTKLPASHRDAARRSLLAARLGSQRLKGSFLLDLPSGASLLEHARRAGLLRQLWTFLAISATSYALFLASWALIGRGALSGRIDRGWLVAWALLLLTQVPLRVLASWVGGQLAVETGTFVKKRLLAGTLEADADTVRGAGAGQLFGRVMESEVLEALALGGGITSLAALLELGFAAIVLALGAAPISHVVALVAWTAGAAAVGARFFRAREHWTASRLEMTHELVERMVGHRTRLAQQEPARWHDGEDESLDRYLKGSGRMDRLGVLLTTLLPRGFLLLGLALLAPAFVKGGIGAGALAVSLGGVLLAHRAFAKLSAGLADISGAAIAWKSAVPLLGAAASKAAPPHPDVASLPLGNEAIVDMNDLSFRRPGRATPILSGASLRVNPGDRLLLQGASGAGKSTLGSLLCGLLQPEAGLLLVGGLDRHTLGARGFRRHIVVSPQFHENHVISSPFAFNLLMGRNWPPRPEDIALAERICRELQLGPLLDRMPGGLYQMVGETGWQLSHGERSRLFIARALLQEAELIVLDESFGALDPETLKGAMKCVMRRAKALLVIAHP